MAFAFRFCIFPWVWEKSAETLPTIITAKSVFHLLLVMSQTLNEALCTRLYWPYFTHANTEVQSNRTRCFLYNNIPHSCLRGFVYKILSIPCACTYTLVLGYPTPPSWIGLSSVTSLGMNKSKKGKGGEEPEVGNSMLYPKSLAPIHNPDWIKVNLVWP